MDIQSIVDRLQSEYGYPKAGAQAIAEKLEKAHPDTQADFSEWWTTGHLPGSQVEEYSVARLIAEHSMQPIAAILTLDWLRRDAKSAIASLGRGHDSVQR